MLENDKTQIVQYTSLRDVILTVKAKLLGADLRDAVRWLQRYLSPRSRFSGAASRLRIPQIFRYDQNFSDDGIFVKEDTEICSSLLCILLEHESFFMQKCYDNYAYPRHVLINFFKINSIDLDFPESAFKSDNIVVSENSCVSETVDGGAAGVDVLYLRTFREDDPLALAIEIRNREWKTYNHNDKSTRANQESIIAELREKGISKKQAESIELVSCPITR